MEYFNTILTNRFRRRVTIPEGVNHESVTSTISPEGILTILAPKMMLEGKKYCQKERPCYLFPVVKYCRL